MANRENKIDLLQREIGELHPKKRKLKIILKISLFLAVFGVIIWGIFSHQVIFSGEGIIENIKKMEVVKQISHLFTSGEKIMLGEKEDRINILLLGIGGANHDGAYLTDTIIVASLKPSMNKISLVSIPRDLSVPIEGYGYRKINSINAIGEAKNKGSGAGFTAKEIEKIFNLPIHYYLRVDFDGFEKLIDELEGIDIYVDNTLEDYRYPVRGMESSYPLASRWEHLYIPKGQHHFDGATALKYVRSRYGINGEGSDFARSRRQQKVLLAIKEKVFSLKTLANVSKLNSLLTAYNNNISTNLQIWEMLKLKKLAAEIDYGAITNKVLDNSQGGMLTSSITEGGAYILKPRSGSFSEISRMIENIFYTETEIAQIAIEKPQEIDQQAQELLRGVTLEVQNGTTYPGLASVNSNILEKEGFDIIKVGNAKEQNYQKTVIYDLTQGAKPASLRNLQKILKANVSVGIASWLTNPNLSSENVFTNKTTYTTEADFLIILGQSAIP